MQVVGRGEGQVEVMRGRRRGDKFSKHQVGSLLNGPQDVDRSMRRPGDATRRDALRCAVLL